MRQWHRVAARLPWLAARRRWHWVAARLWATVGVWLGWDWALERAEPHLRMWAALTVRRPFVRHADDGLYWPSPPYQVGEMVGCEGCGQPVLVTERGALDQWVYDDCTRCAAFAARLEDRDSE